MVTWVAHELGYIDQLNVTFSQSNYLDETVPKQIASDLKHEWLFKALDNGSFLKNIENVTKITGGNVLYYGVAHGLSMYQFINFDRVGLLHSGQLGDVVLGTFYSSLEANKQFSLGDGAYSKNNLLNKLNIELKEEYPNEEIFKMYVRGFYGANQGLFGIMNYTETYSPFYDIDFMKFALSLPLHLRFDHYIYKKWINKKYPKAAKYIWEREKVAVSYPYWIKLKGKSVPLNQFPNKILSKLGFSKYGQNTENNMNPLNFWYNSNKDLKEWMDVFFRSNIETLDEHSEIKKYCTELYFKSNGTEKIQVLSILSLLRILK